MGGRSGDAGAATSSAGATRGPRGFTLLELLITLSVTTIGLVGLLGLHLSVTRGNDGASRSAEAQQIGAATLESMRAQSVGDLMIMLTGAAAPVSTPPYVTAATGRGGMAYTITTTVVVLTASLIRIRVVTSWTEDGGTRGDNGGQLDHALPLELIRTVEEAL